jgi:hypothetical protein
MTTAPKTLLLHDDLVSLNRDLHRQLRVQPPPRSPTAYAFARHTNSMPLAIDELPQAMLDYPCIFVAADQQHSLCAVLGLRDRQNLFVDAQGRWAEGAWLPAFVRRYPFVLAESGRADELQVCIDQCHEGFNAREGERLFDDDGRATPWLERVQTLLVEFHGAMKRTAAFAGRVAALGLLEPRQIEWQTHEASDPQRGRLEGLLAVNEARLRALPAEVLARLAADGDLGLIHAHLLSLNQVPRLAARLSQARIASPAGSETP